jgi:hypothetical protein
MSDREAQRKLPLESILAPLNCNSLQNLLFVVSVIAHRDQLLIFA